jgi:hypothetical protein
MALAKISYVKISESENNNGEVSKIMKSESGMAAGIWRKWRRNGEKRKRNQRSMKRNNGA